MQFRSIEKIKKSVNNELEDKINNYKKKYDLQFQFYDNKISKYEDYTKGKSILNISEGKKIARNFIEKKNIRGYLDNDLNIILNAKLEFNNFTSCKFKDIVFKECKFKGNIFSKCVFENVLFENCIFYESNDINIFLDECMFINSIFKDCNLENSIFKECKISTLKFVDCSLENAILSNMSIYNNRISDCNFKGIKIINSYIEKFKFEDKNITNLDEYSFIDITTKDKKCKKYYEEVSKIYKNISKKLYENNLIDYSSEYYYLSKCIENKYITGLDKIKSTIYWLICGYGEKPTYALITSLEIIFLFAILYMFTGLSIDGDTVNYIEVFSHGFLKRNIITDFMSCLYFSTVTFTTVGYGDITPLNLSIFLSGVEMFLGLTMMGIWTATLARKITR